MASAALRLGHIWVAQRGLGSHLAGAGYWLFGVNCQTMYVCTCVCMHACMYACMYVCVYIYIYTRTHTHTGVFGPDESAEGKTYTGKEWGAMDLPQKRAEVLYIDR